MDNSGEYQLMKTNGFQAVIYEQTERQVNVTAKELSRLVVYFSHRFADVLIQVEQVTPDDLAPDVQQQLIKRMQQLIQELEFLQDRAAWTLIDLALAEKGETQLWNI